MIIKENLDEIANYMTDTSNMKGECTKVYFPETHNEVMDIIRECNKDETQVTVAGNGTGLSGARVPYGGVVVATDKLNRILNIDKEKRTVTLEPGVLVTQLEDELKREGLFYAPDPTETDCYTGGTIATNASGAKSFSYGPTRNFVQRLKIILPTGKTVNLKRGDVRADGYELLLKTEEGEAVEINIKDIEMPAVKNAAGYYLKKGMDAIDLFIGSEGTLGIVTEAELKVLQLPGDLLSAVAFFDDNEAALKFVEQARAKTFDNEKDKAAFKARALEYFDNYSLEFLKEDFPQIPGTPAAAVWFEQEITEDSDQDALTEEWLELVMRSGGDADNIWAAFEGPDREKIRKFRHAVSEKVNDYIARNNFRKLGTDVAVPHDKFRELYSYARTITENAGLHFVAYGHFGDSHLHLNMLPRDNDEHKAGKEIYRKICSKASELGGTVSAEHGVGKLKKEYLLLMYGEENIRKMAEVKKQLDPNCILGIDTVFDKKYLDC